MAGSCPSNGCPEYFFNNQSSFDTEYARAAFLRAMQTIQRCPLSRTQIPRASPLRTEEEMAKFIESAQRLIPDCRNVMMIYSCKHGGILYQRAIRVPNVQNIDDLAKKIKTSLPIDLQKEKGRTIQSYFTT